MTLIKSVLVRRPAKVEVFESQSGADTIAIQHPLVSWSTTHVCEQHNGRGRTILHQNVQTGSDEEIIVEHDESKGERQDIVAGTNPKKFAYGRLEAVRYGPHIVLVHLSSLVASSNPALARHKRIPYSRAEQRPRCSPMGTPHPHARHAAYNGSSRPAEGSPTWDWQQMRQDDGDP